LIAFLRPYAAFITSLFYQHTEEKCGRVLIW
jgi:hypothetical protein